MVHSFCQPWTASLQNVSWTHDSRRIFFVFCVRISVLLCCFTTLFRCVTTDYRFMFHCISETVIWWDYGKGSNYFWLFFWYWTLQSTVQLNWVCPFFAQSQSELSEQHISVLLENYWKGFQPLDNHTLKCGEWNHSQQQRKCLGEGM